MAQGDESFDQLKPGGEQSGKKPDAPAGVQPPSQSGEEGEFTRMFRSLGAVPESSPATVPVVANAPLAQVAREPGPVAPSPAAAPAASAGSAGAEGFTQIFQQIRKPTSAPPEIRKPETSAASGSEGFTQIFSSFQAGPEPARPAAEPVRVQEPGLSPRPVQNPLAPLGTPTAPAARSVPAAAPAFADRSERMEDPDALTQIFEQNPAGQTAAVLPPPRRMESDSAFGAPAPAGSLTETFRSTPAGQAPVAAQPAKGNFGRSEPSFAAPAGQATAVPADSFTEMFRSPAAPLPPAQLGRDNPGQLEGSFAAPPAASSGEGDFTQLFQNLSANPMPAAPPAPASAPPREPTFGSSAGPAFPSRSAAAPVPGSGGGEFTRLMQSLEQPAAIPNVEQQPAAPAPFFAEAPQSSGASEFTRVMRGSGSRDDGASRPAAPAVASAPTAPGMSIAPGKLDLKAVGKPAGKSKQMMILLVILNVILVIAVIVLAVILLRRH